MFLNRALFRFSELTRKQLRRISRQTQETENDRSSEDGVMKSCWIFLSATVESVLLIEITLTKPITTWSQNLLPLKWLEPIVYNIQKRSFFKSQKGPEKFKMSFTVRRIDPYRQRDVVYNPRYRTCTSPGSNAFCSSPAHGEILILLTEVALLVLILNILRRLFTNASFMQQSAKWKFIYTTGVKVSC